MTDLILRIFVRDHKNTEDPAVRDKCGRVAGAVGIVTNFLLFLMKIIVGTVFHSVSVTADAVNNLTDSGSSVVTLIGFKMASKPADEKHPFGHARIEYLSGVIVSFIVIFLGLQLGMSSIEKIITPEENPNIRFSALALGDLKKTTVAAPSAVTNQVPSVAISANQT